jgi:hypothetical protein
MKYCTMSDNSENLGNNLRQVLEDHIQNTLNKQEDSNPDWLIFFGFSEPPDESWNSRLLWNKVLAEINNFITLVFGAIRGW